MSASTLVHAPVELASSPLHLMGLMALLSLVPFAVVTLTSFSKISVVLSFVRSALGTTQAPPTMVLTGLAAALTLHVMSPTLQATWSAARSLDLQRVEAATLLGEAAPIAAPMRAFLFKHSSPDERARLVEVAHELRGTTEAASVSESDLGVLLPAFVLTELEEAFVIGFIVFLPFLVLDMLVANVLLALGMQSLSPSQVSLPFKLLLFVSVDGWSLLSQGLLLGYR